MRAWDRLGSISWRIYTYLQKGRAFDIKPCSSCYGNLIRMRINKPIRALTPGLVQVCLQEQTNRFFCKWPPGGFENSSCFRSKNWCWRESRLRVGQRAELFSGYVNHPSDSLARQRREKSLPMSEYYALPNKVPGTRVASGSLRKDLSIHYQRLTPVLL